MRIAIIGAGLGGLTFGALAAKDGHSVTVFDKNAVPGGVMALAEQDGYRFEQGPLILGDLLPGEPLHALLDSLDIHIHTVRAERGIVMPDYEMWRPDAYAGPYWRRERLKMLFPEDAKGIDEYYRLYENMMRLRWLSKQKQTFFTKLALALTYLKVKPYEALSADGITKQLFRNEKIRALYTGILADFCADPDEVQGIGLPFCNSEAAFDMRIPLDKGGKRCFYSGYVSIVGGCQKLPEALAAYIEAHGGTLRMSTVVDKVLIEQGRAAGVRLSDGTEYSADVVVGCGGGKDFFEKTVGLNHLDDAYRAVLQNFRPMEAVFMLHLGVDYDPMQFLKAPLCYYYGTYDLHAATQKLRSGEYHDGRDGFLVYVPSAHAPEFAPQDKHCVTIYTVAPDTLKDGSWAEKKELYAEHLIALAEKHLPELRKHITMQKIMTAEEYRHYTHMQKCSFGGVVPIRDQKNPPHVTPVKGLYFVGQQSENAGGVGAVALGAKAAYEKLKERSSV